MNYEKKYKKALERASKLKVQNPFDTVGQMVEHIFPELKDEDERIRKAIKKALQVRCGGSRIISDEPVTLEEALEWLEKQKREEAKEVIFRPTAGYSIDIAVLQALKKQRESRDNIVLAFNGAYIPVDGKTADEIVVEYHKCLEKQGGHKGTDNGETEFHVGDLVVINETTYQITEISNSHVVLSFNGRECKFGLDVLNNAQKFAPKSKYSQRCGDWKKGGKQ